MKRQISITKEKIKNYLKKYKNLKEMIEYRELLWILKRGSTFHEWQRGKNTVESQAINLIEDSKLQEYKFYKENLDKYLFILKHDYRKVYYEYVLHKYIHKYPKEMLRKKFRKYDIDKIERQIIEDLYICFRKEASNVKNKRKQNTKR